MNTRHLHIPVAWKSSVIVVLLFISLLIYWYASSLVVPFGNNALPSNISLAAALLFWILLVYLVLSVPMRNALKKCMRLLKSGRWAVVFVAYLSVHLIVYGLLLERILSSVTNYSDYPSIGYHAYFSFTEAFFPHTVGIAVIELLQNPSVVLVAPPYYELVLSAYAFFSAFIIAILVVLQLNLIAAIRRRGKSMMVLYPAIGVAGGATCCISLPALLVNYGVIGVAVATFAAIEDIFLALYFLLPLAVMISFYFSLPHSYR
ncbi:MAG: hypothetical protein QXP70_02825 [Methanomassiliicoccales archaeon]